MLNIVKYENEFITKFENLATKYMGEPMFGCYSYYWDNRKSRISILYSICLMEFGENQNLSIRQKLRYLMNSLIENSETENQIEYKCMDYLVNLRR